MMRRDEDGALWLRWREWLPWVWVNHPERLVEPATAQQTVQTGGDTERAAAPKTAGEQKELFR